MSLRYSIVDHGNGIGAITIITDSDIKVATSDRPAYNQIVKGAVEGDPTVVDLIDSTVAVAKRFEKLTDRITARDGHIYVDGDAVHTALTDKILEFLNAGVEDWVPLVNFFENLLQNPSEHSREQAYEWLRNHKFGLTADGEVVCYKGVGLNFLSVHSGHAIVDGEDFHGQVPNNPGSTIEMPRSEVNHNPSQGCSVGLHAANFDFARGWGSQVVRLLINPRDIVSVPNEARSDKMRVCRYFVDEVVTEEDADLLFQGSSRRAYDYEPDIDDYDEEEDDEASASWDW